MSTSKRNFWLSTNGLAAIGLIAAVVYFLLGEFGDQYQHYLDQTAGFIPNFGTATVATKEN